MVIAAQHFECTKSLKIVHFKMIKMLGFMFCEFYLNFKKILPQMILFYNQSLVTHLNRPTLTVLQTSQIV